jgi:hypothetical protein
VIAAAQFWEQVKKSRCGRVFTAFYAGPPQPAGAGSSSLTRNTSTAVSALAPVHTAQRKRSRASRPLPPVKHYEADGGSDRKGEVPSRPADDAWQRRRDSGSAHRVVRGVPAPGRRPTPADKRSQQCAPWFAFGASCFFEEHGLPPRPASGACTGQRTSAAGLYAMNEGR